MREVFDAEHGFTRRKAGQVGRLALSEGRLEPLLEPSEVDAVVALNELRERGMGKVLLEQPREAVGGRKIVLDAKRLAVQHDQAADQNALGGFGNVKMRRDRRAGSDDL